MDCSVKDCDIRDLKMTFVRIDILNQYKSMQKLYRIMYLSLA